MVFVRKVTLHNKNHYYLFHTSMKDGFHKYKRYIGTKEPNKDRLKKLIKKFEEDIKKRPEIFSNENKQNIISLIQEIQEKNQFIGDADIVKLSKELDIPAVELYGVVTFYSQFKLKKPGKYKISICNGTACHVKKSEAMEKYLEKILKIKPNQTTKDNKFSLESVNCIGACARAPAMMINKQVYGELTEEKIKKIIENLD